MSPFDKKFRVKSTYLSQIITQMTIFSKLSIVTMSLLPNYQNNVNVSLKASKKDSFFLKKKCPYIFLNKTKISL
jgi:CO dehydrogenase/acetyl-CoA synthase epsilon subunit